MDEAFEILSAHAGVTMQDLGRSGWKRFGIPAGGAMDRASARWANLLVGNEPEWPLLEALFGGVKLRARRKSTVALTGAALPGAIPQWRSFTIESGEELVIGGPRRGVWVYLAVAGGFAADEFFGSASVNPRAGLGAPCRTGAILRLHREPPADHVAGRFLPQNQQPILDQEPVIALQKGPEWDFFSPPAKTELLHRRWVVSPRSDRAGYRLEGPDFGTTKEILSSPTLAGTLQVPAHGEPIVLMRDGPTVGGYPRLALVKDVSRLAQCAPGSGFSFRLIDDGHQL